MTEYFNQAKQWLLGGTYFEKQNQAGTTVGSSLETNKRRENALSTSTAGSSNQKSEYWDSFVDSFTSSALHGDWSSPQVCCKEQGSNGVPEVVSFVPAAKRVVAIGDLHGDFQKAVRAFKVAGLVDEKLNWIGGESVAVQVGDVLDRGGEELRIFHFLEKLKQQAAKQGGALHVLNGNHEIMNVGGRFRYATEGAMEEFHKWEKLHRYGQKLKCMCDSNQAQCRKGIADISSSGLEARKRALRPGGTVSKTFLAHNPVALVVGGSVFVHGGLHPKHLDYGIERMNHETSQWMWGESSNPAVPWFLNGRNAIVWSRMYSMPNEDSCNCEMLQQTLGKLPDTTRMIVGHTVQYPMGINSACGDSVFRVDVGFSSGVMDAEPEVLEIINDREVRRLRAYQSAQVLVSSADAEKRHKSRMRLSE